MPNEFPHHPVIKEDEVDLMAVFIRLLETIRANLVLIVLSLFIGVLLGIFLHMRQKPVYEYRLIANSGVLQSTDVFNIVESWNGLLKKNEKELLAERLGLSRDMMKYVYSLEAEEIRENGFMIVVKVGNNVVLGPLQKALVEALQNNPYVRKRTDLKRKRLQTLRNDIAKEIADLEDTRREFKLLLSEKGSRAAGFMIDPGGLNIQLVTLREKLIDIQAQIELLNEIQVVEGFSSSNVPDNQNPLKFLIIGLTAGLMLATAIILLKFFAQKMRTYRTAESWNRNS